MLLRLLVGVSVVVVVVVVAAAAAVSSDDFPSSSNVSNHFVTNFEWARIFNPEFNESLFDINIKLQFISVL